jgi:ABC-type siderophore export system fused ATPase/permease subunit
MSRQITELEALLQQLIDEHRKLLVHMDRQQEAMKAIDLKTMDDVMRLQDAARMRIAGLETKRRNLIVVIARGHRMTQVPTLPDLASMYPAQAATLLKLRGELKETIQKVPSRSHVAGKLAAAVMGHLNTVVRLLAGAVEKAGLYTKQGVPQVSSRIGVMEAVG